MFDDDADENTHREPDHFELCTACNGSGEGYYDGSRCGTCRGNGEVPVFKDPPPFVYVPPAVPLPFEDDDLPF